MTSTMSATGGPRSPGVTVFGRRYPLPRSRILRIAIGTAFFFLGLLFGFLPILGYWMVPVGLLILSYDIPIALRWKRRVSVWAGRQWQRWRPR
jgi:hypothetical protein